uniref:Uncharacterized protein n=1 Tax=Anguilla anguilla TaxID=7936 RepID=A0A0E9SGF7_ANGAN
MDKCVKMLIIGFTLFTFTTIQSSLFLPLFFFIFLFFRFSSSHAVD